MVEPRPQAQVNADRSRVGDVERGACVDRLTRETVAGRLNQQEFDQRVDQALRAQTRGDLAELILDLDEQETSATPGRALARRPTKPVVALTARDVVAGGAFTAVVGVMTLFIGMQMNYGDRVLAWLLLWLFGVVAGAVGALLARSGRPLE